MEKRLLIIEDDPGLQQQMRWCFADCKVEGATNAKETEQQFRKLEPQVVTLDLGLPPNAGGSSVGFEILAKLLQWAPQTKVIVITGREERDNGLQAIASGAYDFYTKPIDSDTLQFAVDRAFKLWSIEQENAQLKNSQPATALGNIITASKSMLDVCKIAEKVAPTDANVLVLGETGTGKELIAQAIHELSDRADYPLVVINCAAIPENLLESELFGHEKGSFTGAVARKIGKIESANGGTLFLDEIGDMALHLQAKILRFLQERTIERVGGTDNIAVDVRVLSATHRPLKQMIEAGEFREDLFFRLSEIEIRIPPLRERKGDEILLSNAFIQKFSKDKPLKLTADCITAIENSPWPGNVRELENRIKRACIMVDGLYIDANDLEIGNTDKSIPLNLKEVRKTAEQEAILQAINRSDGNFTKAAKMLGISRPTLYNLIAKYNIQITE